MRLEDHEKSYEEHLRNLKKAIEDDIGENQRNIGYNVSQGATELFAIYLHKLHLLQTSGDQFDHKIFKNKAMIEKKIPPDFSAREKILELMRNIELERNLICYGKRKPKTRIERLIKLFNELRKIVNKNLKEKAKNKIKGENGTKK